MVEHEPGRIEEIPERLTDHELANLVAAAGNLESKAVLLCAMHPDVSYRQRDLRGLFNGIQGEHPIWRDGSYQATSYTEQSFVNVGLVAKSKPDEEGALYQLTDRGEKLAKPLAGHLLRLSLENPSFALEPLFGRAASNAEYEESELEKRRAADSSTALVLELATAPDHPWRTTDLALAIDSDPSKLHRQLERMARGGLINYETAPKHLAYQLCDVIGEPEMVGTNRRLTAEVYAVLRRLTEEGTELTYLTVAERLMHENPDRMRLSKRSLHNRVNHVMNGLERQGFVEKGEFNKLSKSSTTLNASQRRFFEDVAEVLNGVREGNQTVLDEGEYWARRITAVPDAVKSLLRKSRRNSTRINSRSNAERCSEVLPVLEELGGAATTRHIYRALAERGVRITPEVVYKTLVRELKQSPDRLRRERPGRDVTWVLSE